ncbi:HpcH/HpaI aldolase family protein [Paracoccus laeviglucosivorans]|uniref:4-hydroxy-2-oxoheptanedioate aldolase n=1 Tax=Paracoccus laeviglucosivorans TaxID=1197861 RepID=A0A521F2M5_9RHOB|nr:aldolase/citrate lyase family protein [Paracoccus laeviglucosivorans]SMO90316.1 4-hydroxy-2-oxoheptanedioate aldolase [Paracoccus laeviglucosivorans]
MNRLKQRITAGEQVAAAWVGLGNPDIAEIMARHGWNTLVIDGEHGVGDLDDWVAVARAAEAAGADVVLRVPDGSETLLKRVLDRGFRSLIVPMVNTPEHARAIVGACRYPALGRRGYAAPVVRASGWGARPGYARNEAADELLLILQCEHIEAVENLPEIAALPGVDMLFIGPNDLAGSIDHLERMMEPAPQELLRRIEAGAAAAGKPLATITGAGRDWDKLRALGYRFIVGPSDISLLIAGARGAAAERDQTVAQVVRAY